MIKILRYPYILLWNQYTAVAVFGLISLTVMAFTITTYIGPLMKRSPEEIAAEKAEHLAVWENIDQSKCEIVKMRDDEKVFEFYCDK